MKDDKKETCEMLPVMADCLVEGVKGSMKADIFMAHRLANTIRQHTFIKCAAEGMLLLFIFCHGYDKKLKVS